MGDITLSQGQETVRIPAFAEQKFRVDGNTGLDFYMEQAFQNCFPEIPPLNGNTNMTDAAVVKRPGTAMETALSPTIASYGTEANMACIANMTVTQLYDIYVAAFMDTNASKIYILQYRPVAGTTTKIGEIAGAAVNDYIFITEGFNGDTLAPVIAVTYQKADLSGGNGYYAQAVAGVFPGASLTQLASNFPGQGTRAPGNKYAIPTGPIQFLNGKYYVMTVDGGIVNSSLTSAGNPDITTWNDLALVTATQYPDRGTGVYRYKHHLVAVGQDSIEFWDDAGLPAPASPLQKTDQAFVKFGAYNPKQCATFNDVFYWISYGSNDTTGFWRLNGYTPEKLSNWKVDNWIRGSFNSAARNNAFSIECFLLHGTIHIGLNSVINYTAGYALSGFASSGTDTGGSVITSSIDLRPGILMYSLESGAWWGWADANGTTAMFPTTAFPSNSGTVLARQYSFRRDNSFPSSAGATFSTCKPFYFSVQGGSFTDDFTPISGVSSIKAVTVAIATNTYWFGTNRRKRFNRLTVVRDWVDTSTYVTSYVAYSKTGRYADQTLKRIAATSAKDTRIILNNMGMGRSFSCVYIEKSSDFVRVRGFDLDLGLCTS